MRDSKNIKKGALGRGINSLLGDFDINPGATSTTSPANTSLLSDKKTENTGVLKLRITDIESNPHQPRKIFDESKLKELASSLKRDGLLQPLVVTKGETEGKFVLIAGERRWRASKLAGLEKVPAVIRDCKSDDMLRLALIENIQRDNLNVIEEGEAYEALISDYGLTQEQCAERVGKERATVANILRLLGLPRQIQDDLMDNRISMGHGKVLLSLDNHSLMLKAREAVLKKNLNVRQTEKLVKAMKSGVTGASKDDKAAAKADLEYVAERIRSNLKTKVKVLGSEYKGKIEISYFSPAELERIVALVGGKTL